MHNCQQEFVPCKTVSDCTNLCEPLTDIICGEYYGGIRRCVSQTQYLNKSKPRHLINENVLLMFIMNRNLGYLEPKYIPLNLQKFTPEGEKNPHDWINSNLTWYDRDHDREKGGGGDDDDTSVLTLSIYGPTTNDRVPYEYKTLLPRRLFNGLMKCSPLFTNFVVTSQSALFQSE